MKLKEMILKEYRRRTRGCRHVLGDFLQRAVLAEAAMDIMATQVEGTFSDGRPSPPSSKYVNAYHEAREALGL